MPIDWNACRETKVGTIILPKARMLYPALLEKSMPKGETDPSKAKFQVTALIPKGANLDLLAKRVIEVKDERWTGAQQAKLGTKIRMPVLKTADQAKFAHLADEYPRMIRLNANMKPQVWAMDMKSTVADEEEIYGGRWAAISCNVYTYEHPTGGPGISCGLSNVQLLDHDEMIGGGRVSGEDEFEPAEGGSAEKGATADSVFD